MSEHILSSLVVEIAVPAAFVWDVLVDYPNYPQWNPYTVAATTTLEVGDPIELTLPAPDGSGGTFVNREYVRVVDPPHHLRYDTGEEMPGIFAVRDQWLDVRGPDLCTYYTTDTITGRYADKVIETTGEWVKAGFDSVANALKERAELLWRSEHPQLA
ncbi:MAG: SRPBCC domain-containing protein [Actinophytocola sp.]|uniref:SRPBCC domain-containing protein n=1 Tax=Actinophytocola sp. TaxID=1872138 RepID=UPI001322E680|nr:SRPBCC domain-containing protein [Actinophytocola sp.]MPZ84674.1 SRPBCC domain-containing protein [Actinophytocola sp.]